MKGLAHAVLNMDSRTRSLGFAGDFACSGEVIMKCTLVCSHTSQSLSPDRDLFNDAVFRT